MSERKTRAEMMRVAVGEEPDPLWVPPLFKKRQEQAGNTVRWIRWTEDISTERIDRRLNLRFQAGWEFVKPGDIPEWELAPTMEHGKFGSMIVVGDVALAICPKEIAEAGQRRSEKKAKDMADAVRQNLRTSNPQMDRYTPLRDDSKQHVSTGGRPTHFGE